MGSINRRGSAQAAGLVLASFLFSAGCTQKLPALTAIELMEDPAVLQAVLERCNNLPTMALQDKECRNAREAARRLEAQKEPTSQAASDAQFERAREARRARDELERQRHEAQQQVDPYTMPLAPQISPTPSAAQTTEALEAALQPNG
jgi:hypothetical protein